MDLDPSSKEDSSCRSPHHPTYRPRVVGAALRNLQNTCFINSVLQCLTHTVPLVQKIRMADHSCRSSGEDGDFCSFCALKEDINRCLFYSGCLIGPPVISDNLSKISSDMKLGQHEDAHEFLQSLLDSVHTSFLGSNAKDWLSSQDGDSFVKQIFGGRLRSQLRCCNCGHHSDTFEPLLDLSLEITDVDDISDALTSFTKLEKMEDCETKFTCEGCNSEVAMEKQLKLEQTPEVLILHLKRFKSNGISLYKFHGQVAYPLEIDLNPCLSFPSDEVQSKYDLYAVLVHRGSSTYSGHYLCFIRSSVNTWHEINDSVVTRVSESEVLEQAAYVLFYVKKGSSCWFSEFMEEEKTFHSFDTSPISVLERAERYSPCSSSEDNSSSVRRASEIHDGADLCNVDSPISPTSEAPLILTGEGERAETPYGTDRFDLPVRQPVLRINVNEGRSLGDAICRILERHSQYESIQIEDDLYDDEPLEKDEDNQLLPQVQVKQGSKKEASKPAVLKSAKDPRIHCKTLRSMPKSRRRDILACLESQHKASTKRSLDLSQTSRSKKNKAGSGARSTKTPCRSISSHCIRPELFFHDASL